MATTLQFTGHCLKLADRQVGCGPPVAKHRARETAIKPRIMLRVRNEDCSSDSELADSKIDPFERQTDADFDYLTPKDSGCDIDYASPSQYRKSMAEQPADKSSDEEVEMEEQEESEAIEYVDGDAHDRMVQAQTRGAEGVLAKFLDVTREFKATLEDKRKEELMQSPGINPRKFLAFDDLRRQAAAIYAPGEGTRHDCSVS
jgi:hypothetical protein